MEHFVDELWNPYLLLCFLGVGLYLSILSGFLQGNLPFWWKNTVGQLSKGSFSQISALFTALATTIGTGSIAGVATALWFGGAGAIFWMWVSAFLGMMLSACEKTLTLAYRVPSSKTRGEKNYIGGPMYYLSAKSPLLALFFAIACIFSTLVGGNLVQSASIAQGLLHLWNVPLWLTGAVLSVVVFLALRGGMAMVSKISSVLVPLMALIYLGSGIFCLWQNPIGVTDSLALIFRSAFTPTAMIGGGSGYGVFTALRYGMARGIFSNEGGLGASAMAHGNAQVDHPARQGMWGILEVFFATMIVCTLTALVLLTSGIYVPQEVLYHQETGIAPPIPLGVPMTQAAFSVAMGEWGAVVVLFSLILFAFTSILGWSCYGAMAVDYLFPQKGKKLCQKIYHLALFLCLLWGAMGDTARLWQWVDLSIALMAVPNLIGLLWLAPQSTRLLDEFYQKNRKK